MKRHQFLLIILILSFISIIFVYDNYFSTYLKFYLWEGTSRKISKSQIETKNHTTTNDNSTKSFNVSSIATISASKRSPWIVHQNPQKNNNSTNVVRIEKDDKIMGRPHDPPIVLEEYKLIFFSIQKCG